MPFLSSQEDTFEKRNVRTLALSSDLECINVYMPFPAVSEVANKSEPYDEKCNFLPLSDTREVLKL